MVAALVSLPNPNISVVYAVKSEAQLEARQAMIDGIFYGWFERYDWIIRTNPDTVVLDEGPPGAANCSTVPPLPA